MIREVDAGGVASVSGNVKSFTVAWGGRSEVVVATAVARSEAAAKMCCAGLL